MFYPYDGLSRHLIEEGEIQETKRVDKIIVPICINKGRLKSLFSFSELRVFFIYLVSVLVDLNPYRLTTKMKISAVNQMQSSQ